MKQLPLLFVISILSVTAYSQNKTDMEKFEQEQKDSFSKFQQEQNALFAKYSQDKEKEFNQYRDSINREFASFLEKEWTRFGLKKPNPLIKKPISEPPVYDPTTKPKEEPPVEENPVIAIVPIAPVPPKPEPIVVPIPIQENAIDAIFFGTKIKLKKIPVSLKHLSAVTEKNIAQYWKLLIDIPYMDMVSDAKRIKNELRLNDWGLYQLLNTMFDTYFLGGTANEQVVFTCFMLNQMGYKAKIGMNNNELVPLIAFNNVVTNCMYFLYSDQNATTYYVLNPKQKDMSSIKTCAIDYVDAVNKPSLNLANLPLLATSSVTKPLTFHNDIYRISYNKNMVDYYKDYPCVEFSVYAEAPLDHVMSQSIDACISPNVKGKSQAEAINWLLHFVQKSFDYKTDGEHYGYEKWNFAEETIASSYSDCEDRSILFAQLVRRLLKMPVVLIHYPGLHLATAVKFDDPNVTGDYVVVDGAKYLICDPTYINANLGMAMPNMRNVAIEVFKVK